ncbi:MAG: hypothetical protein AAF152_05065 [Cyanobacteria bacterium P01_A01_bin.114]
MVLVFAIANLSIAAVCLWAAYRFWRWRYQLAQLLLLLDDWDDAAKTQLPQAVQNLKNTQLQLQGWQQQYARWQYRRHQAAQILALIKLFRQTAPLFRRLPKRSSQFPQQKGQ